MVKHLLQEVPRSASSHHGVKPRRDRLHGRDQRQVVGGFASGRASGREKAMDEAIKHGNDIAVNDADAFKAKVITDNKAKVIKLSAAEMKAWRGAMLPVWKKFEGEIGADLIKAASASNN